jgi:peptidoglycan/LPS O-acetylase OafA/YrhL
MPPSRLFYLDFNRLAFLLLIILFHFNVEMLERHRWLPLILPNGAGPFSWGDLGVDLFVILSGAALGVAYKDNFSLKSFYWRRVLALFPMYWVAFIVAVVIRFGIIKTLHPETLWLTLIGMDGFLLYKIPNNYQVGEWFFGMIVILCAVFPLLRACVNKAPLLTLAIGIVWLCVFHPFYAQFFDMIENRNPIMLWPFMVVGMVFVHYFEINPRNTAFMTVFFSAPLLLAYDRVPPLVSYLAVAASLFAVLSIAEKIRARPVRTTITTLAAYTFPAFLMHHVLMNAMMKHWPYVQQASGRWALFGLIILASFGAGWVVRRLTGLVMQSVRLAPARQ